MESQHTPARPHKQTICADDFIRQAEAFEKLAERESRKEHQYIALKHAQTCRQLAEQIAELWPDPFDAAE